MANAESSVLEIFDSSQSKTLGLWCAFQRTLKTLISAIYSGPCAVCSFCKFRNIFKNVFHSFNGWAGPVEE